MTVTTDTDKRTREGKGSHTLTVVRRCLSDSENWLIPETKKDYHFPGVFSTKRPQQLYYINNVTTLEQSCDDLHFMWKDIQLSKGQLNKPRLISADIAGKMEEVYYRSAPCLGVKRCPREGCNHVVPIRDKRRCPAHDMELQKTTGCPVEFVYIHPKESSDNRRWMGGLVRCQKGPCDNLHNHSLHSANKISQCVRQKISDAVSSNPTLTTFDIVQGKGIGFLPSAADDASCHTGKVAQEVRKTKTKKGIHEKNWLPYDFEKVADNVDEEDDKLSGDADKMTTFKKNGRPYLLSAGIENGIKYVFTMSPLMVKIASEAEFIQCDITYDELQDYPYIFNAVAFNSVSMEWMVIARIRLNKQTANAYALAFKKVFERCSSINKDFRPGSTLLGVLIDWSDAEISGLKQAVGKDVGESLLKGCRVHWNRSCLRVADRVTKSAEEKELFLKICYLIPKLNSAVEVVSCFETLCGAQKARDLTNKLKSAQLSQNEVQLIDSQCDWSIAKNWAQWWARHDHLKMLSKVFSPMDSAVWERCPSTTNAVERKNKDCKTENPSSLKMAMIKVYKLDKIACLKHIAAQKNISLSYRSRTNEARSEEAQRKRKQRQKTIPLDKTAQFGPPDRSSNFYPRSEGSQSQGAVELEVGPNSSTSSSRKRKGSPNEETPNEISKKRAVEVDKTVVNVVNICDPKVIGKRVRMLFNVDDHTEEWYEGIIATYNIITGKYGIYFPSDNETVESTLDDEDLEFID